jgi:hypothetical protein
MRKTFICVVGLCLLLGATALLAQMGGGSTGSTAKPTTGTTGATTGTTGTGKAKGKTMAHHGKAAAGSVVSVEPACASFVVKPKKGKDWTFTTDASTTYWNGKKKGACEDLKAGAHAAVTYHMDGDKKVADSVRIQAAKAARPKTTGATTG